MAYASCSVVGEALAVVGSSVVVVGGVRVVTAFVELWFSSRGIHDQVVEIMVRTLIWTLDVLTRPLGPQICKCNLSAL